MSILQAIFYGIIQGIGEFLPISSSAHLIAIPQVFGWVDPGLTFDVALHLGTLIAVLSFFAKDFVNLIFAGLKGTKTSEGMLFWFIALASVPGAVIGKMFEEQAESNFRNLGIIGAMLIVMGVVLYFADKYATQKVNLGKMGISRSFWIGFSQALAIIPGVSRSGVTMSTALFMGLTKESAARFSFLLSTPIVLGAGLIKLKDIAAVSGNEILPFVIGMLVSAIVGFLSIKFLLNYLKTKGFGIFVTYRIFVGALFIAVYFLR